MRNIPLRDRKELGRCHRACELLGALQFRVHRSPIAGIEVVEQILVAQRNKLLFIVADDVRKGPTLRWRYRRRNPRHAKKILRSEVRKLRTLFAAQVHQVLREASVVGNDDVPLGDGIDQHEAPALAERLRSPQRKIEPEFQPLGEIRDVSLRNDEVLGIGESKDGERRLRCAERASLQLVPEWLVGALWIRGFDHEDVRKLESSGRSRIGARMCSCSWIDEDGGSLEWAAADTDCPLLETQGRVPDDGVGAVVTVVGCRPRQVFGTEMLPTVETQGAPVLQPVTNFRVHVEPGTDQHRRCLAEIFVDRRSLLELELAVYTVCRGTGVVGSDVETKRTVQEQACFKDVHGQLELRGATVVRKLPTSERDGLRPGRAHGALRQDPHDGAFRLMREIARPTELDEELVVPVVLRRPSHRQVDFCEGDGHQVDRSLGTGEEIDGHRLRGRNAARLDDGLDRRIYGCRHVDPQCGDAGMNTLKGSSPLWMSPSARCGAGDSNNFAEKLATPGELWIRVLTSHVATRNPSWSH